MEKELRDEEEYSEEEDTFSLGYIESLDDDGGGTIRGRGDKTIIFLEDEKPDGGVEVDQLVMFKKRKLTDDFDAARDILPAE